MTADHFVYWLLNADDECIYVGSTYDPVRRWTEHYRRLGEEIATRRLAGPFTRREAFAKELSEMKRLAPKYNGVLRTMPVRFTTWSAECQSTPDEDVLEQANLLVADRLLARYRARAAAKAAINKAAS
jgi:predicted GIY-YIG superfamily endonuclease